METLFRARAVEHEIVFEITDAARRLSKSDLMEAVSREIAAIEKGEPVRWMPADGKTTEATLDFLHFLLVRLSAGRGVGGVQVHVPIE